MLVFLPVAANIGLQKAVCCFVNLVKPSGKLLAWALDFPVLDLSAGFTALVLPFLLLDGVGLRFNQNTADYSKQGRRFGKDNDAPPPPTLRLCSSSFGFFLREKMRFLEAPACFLQIL